MTKLSKTAKIFLFLLASSTVIWLGNSISRMFFTYNIFQSPDLVLKPFLSENTLKLIFVIHQPMVSISIFAYFAMIAFLILFIITSHLKLRENGWLFISLILVFITAPFEIFLIVKDFDLLMSLFYTDYDLTHVMKIILQRYSVMGSFIILEVLAYFAVIFLFILQPLTKKFSNET
ncbi:MAG TPA: hypothetical protein PKY46_08945 [Ignavibacteriaceae bacterium]|nr:hypothetical protein [Ignavibacteriaceae bacterium]